MKKFNIFNGVAGALAGVVLSSGLVGCSDDYLDLSPVTDLGSNTVTSNITGAHAAMVGLCNGMYRSVEDYTFGINGQNGEPWLLSFYAEGCGNATIQGICTYSTGFANNYANWTYMNTSSADQVAYMWNYCYNLIDDANTIISFINDVEIEEGEEGERDFIKAVALTIRSHAYIRLLQTYAPRWTDSNNGNAYCIILRTEPSTTENADKDFSTVNQVLEQIYSDLDDAIELFDGSDYSRGSNVWMPNEDVANGLYARAALLKNDYNTALEKATEAMSNYSLMSADEYRSGFIYANSEYMWASPLEVQDLFWDTFAGWQGFNGYYISGFGIGDSMDYTLYSNLPMTDCRKYLYFMPELMDLAPNLAGVYGITPGDFFVSEFNGGIVYDEDPSKIFVDGFNYLVDPDDPDSIDNDYAAWDMLDDYAWGTYVDYGFESALVEYDANLSKKWGYAVPTFGMGMKFWGVGAYAFSNFPFMRASEMGYIIAEAQYMLGNEGAAQAMMEKLNKDVRDPQYSCTLSGDALLAHIKAYREIELWDEGFNWFDLKRWGDPCIRNKWVEDDPNSGNWGSFLKSFQPDAMNGWVYAVPETEYNFNKGADPSKLQR